MAGSAIAGVARAGVARTGSTAAGSTGGCPVAAGTGPVVEAISFCSAGVTGSGWAVLVSTGGSGTRLAGGDAGGSEAVVSVTSSLTAISGMSGISSWMGAMSRTSAIATGKSGGAISVVVSKARAADAASNATPEMSARELRMRRASCLNLSWQCFADSG